jgi:hypothetical protein
LLQKAGDYQLRVMLANKNIKDSPFELQVVPGSVASATTHTVPVPNYDDGTVKCVAGSEAVFYVQTQDAYQNDLDREATEITVAAQWQGYFQQTAIDLVDDSDILTAEFGRIYFGHAEYVGDGRFLARYTALREGEYKLYVSSNGVDIGDSPYDVLASPAAMGYGPKSAIEEGQPPKSANAGEHLTLRVQVRDAYGNRITDPRETPTIGLGPVPKDEGVCTDAQQGVFDCAIVPQKAGPRRLEVRVNGLEVLEIANTSTGVQTRRGPFDITIFPGEVHPRSSVILGVLGTYVAGETVPARVQLRPVRQ